jgi:hypothetical protein
MTPVITRPQQRLINIGLFSVAALALVLGIRYQGERLPDEPSVPAAGAGAGGGGPAANPAETGGVASPVEGWFPQSGAGAGCREPVGIDLIGGYGATLTINGISIPEVEMNVKLDADGNPTNELTASRSLGHYTYGPEDTCPNGEVLRATDNVIQACVYRLIEGPESCVVSEYSFDLA